MKDYIADINRLDNRSGITGGRHYGRAEDLTDRAIRRIVGTVIFITASPVDRRSDQEAQQ